MTSGRAPADTRLFRHVVVIGAGIAGLLAARVLADSADTVTLLERDVLPDGPQERPGVPQAHHTHGMLVRGADLFEELFPGLRDELSRAGAPDWDIGERLCAVFGGARAPRTTMGLRMQTFSRTLLETHVRHRVSALPRVRIRDGCHAIGLLHDGTGRRVTGVHVRQRPDRLGERIDADLVIDASGRGSHLTQWLASLGLPAAHETVIDAGVGYASRIYAYQSGPRPDWSAVIEALQPPRLPRGCFAAAIEDDRLIVTLQGVKGHRPPHDEDGFHAFARALGAPIADTITTMRPTTPIRCYARTSNRRIAYHRIKRWPDGLIAIGDAVCAFNPIYGQGMSVAAIEAVLLRDAVSALATRADTRGFARAFQRLIALRTRWPWLLAVLSDWEWQQARAPLPVRCAGWAMRRWTSRIPHDPVMFEAFIRIMNMVSGPGSLLRPRILARLVTVRHGAPPAPSPRALQEQP
ncbi:NAD(P)/FAD-dependent oxidoreductase [Streptomyces sp. MNP-20]|uniref:NAD(P)/FAD-dependent oxidoreductase n=1 Tax=Streptomyces sp. MNP-20 TaxID=2721165 RepID=UPI0015578D05|nr:FAD-dependent monooxygenase [Streptomyces sp. MNP-20]